MLSRGVLVCFRQGTTLVGQQGVVWAGGSLVGRLASVCPDPVPVHIARWWRRKVIEPLQPGESFSSSSAIRHNSRAGSLIF